MTVAELIKALQEIPEDHRDVQVIIDLGEGGLRSVMYTETRLVSMHPGFRITLGRRGQ